MNPDLERLRDAVSDERGREVWWCKTHESRFLEKQPSKHALCLLSLHERNFQAIGWEDCDPVLVRVVPVPVGGGQNHTFGGQMTPDLERLRDDIVVVATAWRAE